MRALIWTFVIVSFLGLPQVEGRRSSRADQPLIVGLMVSFHKKLNKKQKKKMLRLVQKTKFTSHKFGKSIPFLTIKQKWPLSERRAKKYCGKFKKIKIVKNCFYDTKPTISEARDGTTTATSTFNTTPSSVPICGHFPDHPDVDFSGRGISDYWSEEATGRDLVQAEIEASTHLNLEKRIIVCDGTTDNHNERVAAIANNNSKNDRTSYVHCGLADSQTVELLDDLISNHPHEKRIVNRSIQSNLENWETPSELTKAYASENIIWINAAGNMWANAEGIPKFLRQLATREVFVIGNLNENGLPRATSSEGRGVLVSAPVGDGVLSCPKNRTQCTYSGGTSSATPQVSHGVDAAFMQAPHLLRHQVRSIIEKTAIPTVASFERPRKNGAGLFNAYKLWRIAEKLGRTCIIHPDPETCYDDHLSKASSFQFPPEITDSEVKSIFSICHQGHEARNCAQEKKYLNKLRRSAFLNPDNSLYWQTISCLQNLEGFPKGAEFYANIGRNFHSRPLTMAELGIESLSPEALRSARYMENPHAELLGLNKVDIGEWEKTAANLWRHDLSPHQVIAGAIAKGDPENRTDILRNLNSMTPDAKEHIISALKHPDPDVQSHAITAVTLWNKDKDTKKEMIKIALRETSGPSLAHAHQVGASVLKEDFFPIAETNVESKDPQVRKAIARGLGKFKHPKSHQILIGLLGDSDSDVRSKAAHSLFGLGQPDSLIPLIDHSDPHMVSLAEGFLWAMTSWDHAPKAQERAKSIIVSTCKREISHPICQP